jgi:hypothetical protein
LKFSNRTIVNLDQSEPDYARYCCVYILILCSDVCMCVARNTTMEVHLQYQSGNLCKICYDMSHFHAYTEHFSDQLMCQEHWSYKRGQSSWNLLHLKYHQVFSLSVLSNTQFCFTVCICKVALLPLHTLATLWVCNINTQIHRPETCTSFMRTELGLHVNCDNTKSVFIISKCASAIRSVSFTLKVIAHHWAIWSNLLGPGLWDNVM